MAKNNNLGVKGWVYAGHYGPQRYAYTLQRLTGIGIITYMLIHIFVTGVKIQGKGAWDSIMATVANPAMHFGEYLVMLAIVIHALNGFRLVWVELGISLGQPIKNVYPYQTCLDRNRVFFWIMAVLIVAMAALGTAEFFKFL